MVKTASETKKLKKSQLCLNIYATTDNNIFKIWYFFTQMYFVQGRNLNNFHNTHNRITRSKMLSS